MTTQAVSHTQDAGLGYDPAAYFELEAQLLKRVDDEITPYVRLQAAEMERSRRLSDDVVAKLGEVGLTQLLRPKRFGGIEAPLDMVYRLGRRLARGDGSVAWIYTIGNQHEHIVALYPLEAQQEYWESARPHCASSFIPTGTATPAPGGYTLSGKWSFCSGIDFCDWILIGATVSGGLSYFLVPTAKGTIVDDWFVSGMRATGSKTLVLDNVFVPASHILADHQIDNQSAPGIGLHQAPYLKGPVWAISAFSLTVAATGIAWAAYEELRSDLTRRRENGDPGIAAKLGALQTHFAELSVTLDMSDMLYNRALAQTFGQLAETGSIDMDLRIRNRRDLAYSVVLAKQATDRIISMAGARHLYEGSLIQRCWRDVAAASTHVAVNWDMRAISYGNVELGGQPLELRI